MPKLSKRFIDSIIPPSQKHHEVFWDDQIKGFGLRVMPTGFKTYFFRYRIDNKDKKIKIGSHPYITSDEARNVAKDLASKTTKGVDPNQEKAKIKSIPNLSQLAKEYMEFHAKEKKRPSSQKNDLSMLNNHILPKFSDKKLNEISRKDIDIFYLSLKRTPIQANRILSLLSKMFNLAINWGYINEQPVLGIEKNRELKRDRWLDSEELDQFWKVLLKYKNNTTADAIRMLILTGARKNEVLKCTWDQIDLSKGIWAKQAHTTKQKKTEYYALSEKVLILLLERKKLNPNSIFVFPGNVEGQPLKEPKRFWKTLLRESGIKDLRLHDLRHTHASHLVSKGLSLPIVGKLLGHTQPSTTQRYAHLANSVLRDAANLFSDSINDD